MSEDSKIVEKFEEKNNEQKFSEKELEIVNSLREKYNEVQFRLGQTKISQIRLHQQIEDLDKFEEELSNKFVETQEEEKKFLEGITKKYGQGELDLDTGVFHPIKS